MQPAFETTKALVPYRGPQPAPVWPAMPADAYEPDKGTFKRWCFTSFWMDDTPKFDKKKHKYLCFGLEVCPTTNRRHFQGYVEFHRPRSKRTVTETFGGDHKFHSRVFVSRGSAEDNKRYCSKDGAFIEFGSSDNKQGERTDLQDACDLKNVDELIELQPTTFVRYGRGLKELYLRKATRGIRPQPVIAVFYGPTGTGKSQMAEAIAGRDPSEAYWVLAKETPGTSWWEDYMGQPYVVLNEFDPAMYSIKYMLQLLDRYPFRVSVKFGSANFVSHLIIITTKLAPSEWYPNDPATPDLLRRLERFGYVEDFGNFRLTDDERRRVRCWGPMIPEENQYLLEEPKENKVSKLTDADIDEVLAELTQ